VVGTRLTGVRGVAAVLVIAASSLGASWASSPATSAATAPQPVRVTWMTGDRAPSTPSRYDRVGVIKVGPSSAKNVLVLEPGTSASGAYFVPFARWVVARVPGWQVWAVVRRESLLQDESELNRFKRHEVSSTQLFDYYLGYLKTPSVKTHYTPVTTSSVGFAKNWGMDVAVQDLHRVVGAAQKLGGKVVLGGHSLGGSVVTAYATWDFDGHAGADGLAGLVYIDGGSGPAVTATKATQELATLDKPAASPWLAFGGISAPYAGIFSATGSASALLDPDGPSLGQSSGLLPSEIVPSEKVTNAAQFGYALNAATSPSNLLAAQAHLGTGISTRAVGGYHTWNGAGALTPLQRFATMLSGYPMLTATGSEWYFPERLTDDTGAVGNGVANPAQQVLGVDATMGRDLPTSLRILAICTVLGGTAVLTAAQTLAAQSHIPASHLTLVNDASTYSHNDPAGAYPHNAFFSHLVPYLEAIAH
jgi:pimeloyl-ACP methyl ester carboxylesterase